VDGLDAAILRAMFRSGEWSLDGVDPLLSPTEIAQRVGRSPNTVRRRLAGWRTEGFLQGFAAIPNPGLLGLDVHLQLLVVEGLNGCERFEHELDLLETPAIVYRMGTSYGVFAVTRGGRTAARDRERLRRLPSLRLVSDPIPIAFPPPARAMRRADWQLLAALRAEPSVTPRAVCLREGGSARSCHRRLASWLDGNLVFFLPLLDFEHARGTVAWIGSVVNSRVDAGTIDHVVGKAFPDRIRIQNVFPIERLFPPPPGGERSGSLQFFLPAHSAQSAEVAYARFCHLPGVGQAMLAFPTRNYALPSVIDDAIAETLEHGGTGEGRAAAVSATLAESSFDRIPRPAVGGEGIAAIRPSGLIQTASGTTSRPALEGSIRRPALSRKS